jgi:uncharacterized membrane protein
MNKVIGLLLTKLVNENRTDWDEHLHIILFAYRTAFEVGKCHTPFWLVYGLHVLMLTKYLLPITNSMTFQDFAMTWVLSTRLLELEKLEES